MFYDTPQITKQPGVEVFKLEGMPPAPEPLRRIATIAPQQEFEPTTIAPPSGFDNAPMAMPGKAESLQRILRPRATETMQMPAGAMPRAPAPEALVLPPPDPQPMARETIPAEDAPYTLQRIARKDLVSPIIREGISSGKPGIKRIALREAGIPYEIQDLVNVDTPEPARPDHSNDKPRGFWKGLYHRLEHAGKGAIGGLIASGGNPFGALAGALAGGIKPELADNLEYHTQTLPRWRSENKQRQADADSKLQRIKDISNITGIDPVTGKPILAVEQADALNDYRIEGLGIRDRDLLFKQQKEQNARADRERRYAIQDTNTMLRAYNSGVLNSNPDALRALADRLSIEGEVPDKFLAGTIRQVIDSQGNFATHNLQTGQVTSTGSQLPAGRKTDEGSMGNDSPAPASSRYIETRKGKDGKLYGILSKTPDGKGGFTYQAEAVQ